MIIVHRHSFRICFWLHNIRKYSLNFRGLVRGPFAKYDSSGVPTAHDEVIKRRFQSALYIVLLFIMRDNGSHRDDS